MKHLISLFLAFSFFVGSLSAQNLIKPFKKGEVLPDSIKKRVLSFSSATPEEIAEIFVVALNKRDTTALLNISLSPKEFKQWFWPDNESSDPKYNIPTESAWELHFLNSAKGMLKALSSHGGEKLTFEGLRMKGKPDEYRTFKLHLYPEVIARDEKGNQVIIKQIVAIIEMNKRFKILNYTEKR
ncbi:MAG: hypothetical protein SFU91_06895 [Chloroherpetonaceae bacterium]|nr:hypothetical protein [Chloroherpetonaceae bacterium]